MDWQRVGVIARKEFRDVLRDRRTLIFMMLLPIVVMPLLMLGLFKFVASQAEARQTKVLRIAASAMDANTLRALQGAWYQANSAALSAIWIQLGVDSLGGVPELGSLLDRLSRLERARGDAPARDRQTAEGARIAVETSPLEAGVTALAALSEEQSALLQEARVIQKLLANTEFVPFDELSGQGTLAEGVEVPRGLPRPLSDPMVSLAVQQKEIVAAIQIPDEALARLDEVPRAMPFGTLVEERSGERFDSGAFTLLNRPGALASVPIHVLYDSSQGLSKEAFERLQGFVEAINGLANQERLSLARLPTGFAEPLALQAANVASPSRRIQAMLGGILPYLLFAFCFFGALYPALDVTAGEKERFTLETLLLSPASRLDIAMGKFVVVFVAAIIAALLTTTSMVLTFTHGLLPAELMASLDIRFQPLALALTGSLVIPVAALYAAALLAVGLYARSFKEAQSYTVPLQFLFVLPTVVSLIPDVEADSYLAWIPFVNIAILMKELLKGNYIWSFYAITLASTLLLTGLALFVASRLFCRESVLLRS